MKKFVSIFVFLSLISIIFFLNYSKSETTTTKTTCPKCPEPIIIPSKIQADCSEERWVETDKNGNPLNPKDLDPKENIINNNGNTGTVDNRNLILTIFGSLGGVFLGAGALITSIIVLAGLILLIGSIITFIIIRKRISPKKTGYSFAEAIMKKQKKKSFATRAQQLITATEDAFTSVEDLSENDLSDIELDELSDGGDDDIMMLMENKNDNNKNENKNKKIEEIENVKPEIEVMNFDNNNDEEFEDETYE